MPGRALLWIAGAVAILLFLPVGRFAFGTLGPELGCFPAPEARFWGYGADVFDRCFEPVSAQVLAEYRSILLSADRLFAILLTSFLVLASIRWRVRLALLAALGYGLSDWFENGFLVRALSGDAEAITPAALLTVAKFACLSLAAVLLIRAVLQDRSSR